MDSTLQTLQTTLVTEALTIIQHDCEQGLALLQQYRTDLLQMLMQYIGQPLNAGTLYVLRPLITDIMQHYEHLFIEFFIASLIEATHIGARMLEEICAFHELDIQCVEVNDILHLEEIILIPALSRFESYFQSLEKRIYQYLYNGIMLIQPMTSVIENIGVLIPSFKSSLSNGYVWRLSSLITTEVGRAVSEGTQAMLEAMMSSISHLMKQWVCTSNNGRVGHRALQGITISPLQAFIVAALPGAAVEYLRFPRDEDGSAENVVNCACFIVPVIG